MWKLRGLWWNGRKVRGSLDGVDGDGDDENGRRNTGRAQRSLYSSFAATFV